VAAASVLAKTARDAWMRTLDEQYPGYGFARHKGYGTALHQQAIQRLGLCAEHRKSFSIQKQTAQTQRPPRCTKDR
jgi:ribonuclease HII